MRGMTEYDSEDHLLACRPLWGGPWGAGPEEDDSTENSVTLLTMSWGSDLPVFPFPTLDCRRPFPPSPTLEPQPPYWEAVDVV